MPVVKGGVWTNIEDEILKASVSKYGLNQWARVSSLLARKTPKQCKARWTEWLDPSIKKIEWSRDEDEKLLHLAKLMPTQWRTIAPIVGRTANQCLERYQKLLDEAEAREASELALTGPDGGEASAPTADSVRKLRPGELDPDPETKPAKPDTIDLDEDEKEMLSEARARLANTQGKKAKRKARERQQEESRRLATLAKRRELKSAGINIKIATRKAGQMDYNADIPFEKKPVPGFHDTVEEQSKNELQRANFDPRKVQLATKRKGENGDDPDRKRRKNDKDGPSASWQAAVKAGQMQKIREAEQSSKRRALVLPVPQVTEGELEEIVKMGRMGEEASRLAREGDNDATRGLVGSYATLNAGTPIRTPTAAPQDDHIANELRNIRAEAQTQSVLLGGENPDVIEGRGSTGFGGAAPKQHVVSTPNPLATPLRQGLNGAATPMRPGQTPMRTPRDAFALNQGDGTSTAPATPRDVRTAQLALRTGLRRGLASLPRPRAVELELDKMVPDEEQETVAVDDREEDAGVRDRREREARAAREAEEARRRTQVMQRNLPRPAEVDLPCLLSRADLMPTPEEILVARETALLIADDAVRYPVPDLKFVGNPATLEKFPDDVLADARQQILLECKEVPGRDAIEAAFGARNAHSVLPGLSGYEDEEEDRAAAKNATFQALRTSLLTAAEKDAKQEARLERRLLGYEKRQQTLRGKMAEASEALRAARCALSGFRALAGSEQVAVQRRLEGLREEVGFMSRREREAQDRYRQAKEELDSLMESGVDGIR